MEHDENEDGAVEISYGELSYEELENLIEAAVEAKKVFEEKSRQLDEERALLEKDQKKLKDDIRKFEREKASYTDQRLEISHARRELESLRASFERDKEIEKKRQAQQQQLFETKWKILEKELAELSEEKKQFELHKEFRARVNDFEKNSHTSSDYEILFNGINSELALRKRYKDLIKIFHPDNVGGDLDTVQEINRQYEDLKRQYGA